MQHVVTDLVFVGCRTTAARNARGRGLTTWRRSVTPWEPRSLTPMVNPSWLTPHPNGRVVYAAHGDGETISAVGLDEDTPRLLATQPSGGTNPVHLLVLDDLLAVANYGSGSIALLHLGSEGELGPVHRVVDLPGAPGSQHPEQASSHPHHIVADVTRGLIHVPDKGFDVVHHLSIAADTPAWVGSSPTPAGAGPRHLVLHPRLAFAYVVHELAASVGVYRILDDGSFELAQTLSTVPPGAPPTIASAIALTADARHLYVTNRGHDSIAHFTVSKSGTLASAGRMACGAFPRFMTIDPSGTALLVAHERGDSIVPFTINPASGALAAGDPVASTGSPVCIAFAARREPRRAGNS
jgi:6-phosphogluconolactonase